MNLTTYPISASETLMTFEFISTGPKGKISKKIYFQPTHFEGVFNLAFGDKEDDTDDLNDETVSNNGDKEIILATIAHTVLIFTNFYPDAWIYATGSTKARTRLYRMGLNKILDEIANDYELFGELEDQWIPFKKNTEFQGFLIRRKKKNSNFTQPSIAK